MEARVCVVSTEEGKEILTMPINATFLALRERLEQCGRFNCAFRVNGAIMHESAEKDILLSVFADKDSKLKADFFPVKAKGVLKFKFVPEGKPKFLPIIRKYIAHSEPFTVIRGEPIDCQIITTGPNFVLSDGHHRIPCAFSEEAFVCMKERPNDSGIRKLDLITLMEYVPITRLLKSGKVVPALYVKKFSALPPDEREQTETLGRPAPLLIDANTSTVAKGRLSRLYLTKYGEEHRYSKTNKLCINVESPQLNRLDELCLENKQRLAPFVEGRVGVSDKFFFRFKRSSPETTTDAQGLAKKPKHCRE